MILHDTQMLLTLIRGGGLAVHPPCHGMSPSGFHWIYAMAEHTATATVQPWLAEHLFPDANAGPNASKCEHSHVPIISTGVNFTFTFVASPFRRVLSNAAHRSVIPGGRSGMPSSHINRTAVVQAFRRFVLHGLIVKKHHNIPHGIWVQSYMLDMFPKTRFVGNLSNLDRSFRQLLKLLGHPATIFDGFNY